LESNKEKRPNGYLAQGGQDNVSLDDDDDDGIEFEFVMCGLAVPNNDMCAEFEELTLDGVVTTDRHADVIVNDKVEYKKCFKPDMCEAVLAGMEFTDSVRVLSDPTIWIGDTTKSGHTSPYKHEMVPVIKTENDEIITVGNRISEKTAMYGDISGTVCNKKVDTMGWVKLTHVAYSPGMKFKLCSLSKLCQDGWKMEGHKELVLTERNNQQIKFVIKVTTETGDVYCM
jgi:hypothetical protein